MNAVRTNHNVCRGTAAITKVDLQSVPDLIEAHCAVPKMDVPDSAEQHIVQVPTMYMQVWRSEPVLHLVIQRQTERHFAVRGVEAASGLGTTSDRRNLLQQTQPAQCRGRIGR
ncbi:hypothetical protein MOQ72_32235 [Saccharopolyspora sp. K220]|uniref:hypothetical protein n=1 Tax=Saccharopolyspora soli TaxID=2926618 RepID=UPI001F577B6B|nr:hypothetical protein [Saccharopolyspora soli]MCI2422110.1 hypothetical protein [Saccharopolyspora soli]